MIDTRFPLTVAPLSEGVENRAYVDSWKSRPA
jgi:homogentisate 1,2-dioxygenase